MAMVRKFSDTSADRDPPGGELLLRHSLADPLSQLCCFLGTLPRKKNRELLTTVAGRAVARASAGPQNVGDPLQDFVTRRMPVGIVVLLEVVHVEHDHGKRVILT